MMSNPDDSPRRTVRILACAGAILLACLAFDLIESGRLESLATARSLWSRRDLLFAASYLGTYVVAVAAIVVSVFSRSAIVRWVALALVLGSLGLEITCRFLIGGSIGFSEVHTALSEISFAGQFMHAYTASVIKAAVIAGLFTAALAIIGHWAKIRFRLRWLLLVPLASATIYGVLWRTVASLDVYPAPLRIPVLLVYTTLNSLDAGPRDPVEMTADRASQPRALIVVMDESIRGDRLTINGSRRDTTPYLAHIADRYLNFGIAAAASNISSATNVIVRNGLRSEDLPDRGQLGLRNPSIFQYAQAAGYRTCYLDAQYAPGVLENFMSRYDLESIDETYWAIADEPDPAKRYRRDRLLAERILELLADGQPTFIWVNKYGAHVHYDYAYPGDERVFEPTMPPGRSIDACSLDEIENSYANALRWSVDGFFEVLAPHLDLADTVVLYTSDHGQSFKEGRGTAMHADRTDPPVSQANVPLLGWGQRLEARLPDGVAAVHDRLSHFQIFPTALVLMGFDENEVATRYGPTLWAAPPHTRVFLSGDVFGRGIVHINAFDHEREPSTTAPEQP